MVEHRLLQRHRKLLLRLKADGGVELLSVLDQRQLEHAQGHALAGQPEADVLGKLVLGEELPELLGETLGIGDLTLVEEPGEQGLGGRLPEDRAVAVAELGGGQKAGLDVQAHDRPALLLCE